MNLFQWLAIIVVAGLLFLSLAAMLRGWATRRESLIWSTVWVVAGAAIFWPDVTGRIAKAVGIGRGADLLLYCSVVVMLVGFLMIYVRMRRIRRELTLIVRHLAISEARADARSTQPTVTATPTGQHDQPDE